MITDGGARFGLHQGERQRGAPTAAVAFGVADLDAEMARLAADGITPTDREVTDTGMARFTTYLDPDGNEVQLLGAMTGSIITVQEFEERLAAICTGGGGTGLPKRER